MIGGIDGDMMGQIVGGQIGGISKALPQSGCIWPLVHWQVHSALACSPNIMLTENASKATHFRMFISLARHKVIAPVANAAGHSQCGCYHAVANVNPRA
jgi:hypothetical protein